MSRSVSVTTAGQCRLAPLIQVILDCSHLYDYTVKLLFKLHSCEYDPLLQTGPGNAAPLGLGFSFILGTSSALGVLE